jgi:hypothetical protein
MMGSYRSTLSTKPRARNHYFGPGRGQSRFAIIIPRSQSFGGLHALPRGLGYPHRTVAQVNQHHVYSGVSVTVSGPVSDRGIILDPGRRWEMVGLVQTLQSMEGTWGLIHPYHTVTCKTTLPQHPMYRLSSDSLYSGSWRGTLSG